MIIETKILKRIRYTLIKWLAGDIPVLLNINISRPDGYMGDAEIKNEKVMTWVYEPQVNFYKSTRLR